jgi:hypothetical protein
MPKWDLFEEAPHGAPLFIAIGRKRQQKGKPAGSGSEFVFSILCGQGRLGSAGGVAPRTKLVMTERLCVA